MTRKLKTTPTEVTAASKERISLGALLSEKEPMTRFSFWIVGVTPLICHAWAQKARLEMLQKQTGATRTGKEPRNPEQDFINSLYRMNADSEKKAVYGFPVTAIKKSILASAHKDRGIPRANVMTALWLDAEVVRARPALAGAVCDMPLVRVYGSDPEMREDPGVIGGGLRKTATLIYRGEFSVWAIKVTGEINPVVVAPHQLAFLIRQSGKGIGIGDWRSEKNGVMGAYRLASPAEEKDWEAFAAGKGPLPVPAHYRLAAE